MISFITNLLRTFVFACFMKEFITRTCPNLIVTVSFNVIYMISVIQIKLKNAQKYIYATNPRLVELLELYNNQHIENMIDYVLDGKIIYSTTSCGSNNNLQLNQDFIIYSDYKSKDNNKKILENLTGNHDQFDYENTDIKFLLLELKNGDNTYKIDLKSDSFNFYIVGNCFTKKFFQYYLNEVLKSSELISKNLCLKIIDHNVDTVEVEFTDNNEKVLLEKNSYKLLNTPN